MINKPLELLDEIEQELVKFCGVEQSCSTCPFDDCRNIVQFDLAIALGKARALNADD